MQSFAGEKLIDTKHEDHIHDVQWDYYARKLATASSDRTIKVWQLQGESDYTLNATLTGHDGPVWEVAWAHPRWGTVLASCSYDGSVLVYREENAGNWIADYKWSGSSGSINSIEWAPVEHGHPMLACACSDGHFSVLAYAIEARTWRCCHRQAASALGCNSVSWAPVGAIGGRGPGEEADALRIASGSCDNLVKIWRAAVPPIAEGGLDAVVSGAAQTHWKLESMTAERVHKEWVRDVAFAPFNGVPVALLASCSEDRTVYVWTRATHEQPWTPMLMRAFENPVWRVSWSVTGNILAVSSGDDDVSLWKENLAGDSWARIDQPE